MNTKTHVIAAAIGLVVVIGVVAFLLKPVVEPVPQAPVSTQSKASMVPYENTEYGLSFSYPSNLFVHERDSGTEALPQLSLFLTQDTKENRDVLEGRATDAREGPTGISIDVYENPKGLSASDWMKTDTNWTVANSTATPLMIGTVVGASYTWSGLYEGKTVVLVRGSRAYVFSVTWMTAEDQIILDFDMVLNSFAN